MISILNASEPGLSAGDGHAQWLEWPLWVSSGPSGLYHPNGRYGVYSGRSAGFFQMRISERPLFSKAVNRSAGNTVF